MARKLTVQANWDHEAEVWVATSEEVPGLVTEADTVEALLEKLRILIPELLAENGIEAPVEDHELPFDILAQRHESVPIAC